MLVTRAVCLERRSGSLLAGLIGDRLFIGIVQIFEHQVDLAFQYPFGGKGRQFVLREEPFIQNIECCRERAARDLAENEYFVSVVHGGRMVMAFFIQYRQQPYWLYIQSGLFAYLFYGDFVR